MSTRNPPPDILFLSPTIISGDPITHDPSTQPYVADVLISSGIISQIGPDILAPSGARRIDARGHYLSPGFIDMHAHSDLYLLTHPAHEPKISQGCTVRIPHLLLG